MARYSPTGTNSRGRPDRPRPTRCSCDPCLRPPAARSRPVDAERSTAAARLIGTTGNAGMPGEGVDVGLRAGTMILPGRPAVVGAHEPTELDPDQQEISVVRARRDPAHVRCPRSGRKAPRRPGRKLEQRVERPPGLAPVDTPKEATRLGAGIEESVCGADRKGEDCGLGQRAVDPVPSGILRASHTTLAQAGVDRVRVVRVDGEALRATAEE